MSLTPTDVPPLPGSTAGDASMKAVTVKGGGLERARRSLGLTPKAFKAALILPAFCIVLIVATLVAAPSDERITIVLATLVAAAAGLSSTAIGVYGGVLVPGLLLLGVDARYAAVASLFLQVLVIPLGAGAHYRVGNVSRIVALPLILGGVTGAFIGPFFAAALPKDVIARVVAGLIVLVGVAVLATLHWGGLGSVRPLSETPRGRVGGIGLTAGFASGISGAGWGPIGVKLLILTRIEPRIAIGSSLFGRIFMAMAAVVGYVISSTAFKDVKPDYWLLVPLFAGSVAAMLPGAMAVSKLGRERATIAITALSISLALPTLIFGH
jgi:uncharacterized membrane protein YfcA